MADNDKGRGVLKDVALYFTSIQTPRNKYESELKHYTTTIVMDKATSTAFSKQFPKKKINPLANDDFIEKYKTDVPFPEQAIQYVMNLSQDELKKDGTPMPDFLRPRALLEDASGQIYDITESLLIGNGSRGDVNYSWYTTNFGPAVRLSNVVIKKLVPYEKKDSDYIDMTTVQKLPEGFDLSQVSVASNANNKQTSVGASTKPESKPRPNIQDQSLPF